MLPGILQGKLVSAADPYTKLLLHFDGNYTDSSPTRKGNGTPAGAGALVTTTKKFGTHSYQNSNNGYITFPNHADYSFGSGDWTIDFWYWTTAAGAMLSRDLSSTYVPWLFINHGTGPVFYASSTGTSWDMTGGAPMSMGPNTAGRFMHLAVTRKGNNWKTYQDGAVISAWGFGGSVVGNSNPLCIGAYANANNAGGYTDELRISKGIARWDGAFTPPTNPYL